MKNNETVSVIIPVYKVEDYLEKCVKSAINQTYKNLEIILVDDGSPDKCPQICDDLAKSDNRIHVIHKKNGGLSSARNAGLDIATGQWCYFIDSDDSIDAKAIETCVKYMKQYDVDCVVHSFVNIPEDESCISMAQSTENWLNERKKDTGLYDVPINISAEIPAVAWNKLYKTEIIKKYNCRFPEGLINEDEEFIWSYFVHCKKYYNINDCLYFYLRRTGSIMGQRNTSVKVLDILKIHMHIYDIVKKYKNIDEYKDALTQNYVQTVQWLFPSVPVKYQKQFLRYVKDYIRTLNNDKSVRLLYKNLKHLRFANKMKSIWARCSHTVKHYRHILYSHSKRGIKQILNAKINELSNNLKDINSKIARLSDALNIQKKETEAEIARLSNQRKESDFKINNLKSIYTEIITSVVDGKNPEHNLYDQLAITDNNDIAVKKELQKLGSFYYLPNKGNLGDVLIAFSTYQFFDANNFNYEVFDMTNVSSYTKPFNFVYGGGGIWNAFYKQDYQEILDVFKNPLLEKCVILPSSFYDCKDVLDVLDERFTVFCREEQSYKYCKSLNKKARFLLASDMVIDANLECFYGEIYNRENLHQFLLDENIVTNLLNVIFRRYKPAHDKLMEKLESIKNKKVAYMVRGDKEGVNKGLLSDIDLSDFGGGYCSDKSYDFIQSSLFVYAINMFDVIVTDRLHVAICAAKLNKHVILLDNSYKKNSSVYNYSLKSFKSVHLVAPQEVEALVSKLSNKKTVKHEIKIPSKFIDFISVYGSIKNTYGIEKRWWY